MTPLLPFLYSFLLGLLITSVALRKSQNIGSFLFCLLSVGIGLGASSTLIFFSFLLCGGFNIPIIILLHAGLTLALAMILFAGRYRHIKFNANQIFSSWVYIILFAAASYVVYILACSHPFGEWDGWAVWNMKAKFLIASTSNWKDLFQELHWHTQPDYPLLLPMINVWGSTMIQKYSPQVPFWTGIIFTVACPALVFSGLKQYAENRTALLGSCLILFLPAYIYLGTTQYADIVFAYYLLAVCVCFVLFTREKENGFGILLGLFLGFLSFSKNEGFVAFLLFFILIFFYRCRPFKKIWTNLSSLLPVVQGLIFTLPAPLIFKFFLSPANRDITLKNSPSSLKFLNWEGCYLVTTSFFQEISSAVWNYLWIALAILIVWRAPRFIKKESGVLTLFFLCYALCVFFVYLTTANFDLMWRLSRTLQRILFCLLPSLVFLVFYCCWNKEKANTPNEKP
ncbi:MAG: glycosyltransferase family 39 protein [Candidatus Omnitrophota bacterium]